MRAVADRARIEVLENEDGLTARDATARKELSILIADSFNGREGGRERVSFG